MSTTSLMSLGVRAMAAAQVQLRTTGHNITNAGVEGYSRQSAELATAEGRYSGAGYLGSGVEVTTVSRATQRFLTAQVAHGRSQAAADAARLDLAGRLEAAVGRAEDGLGRAAEDLFAAFTDLASAPADLSVRQVVLGRAEALASHFRGTGDALASLQTAVRDEAADAVARINDRADAIATLNRRIAASASSEHAPNDLLDQRDRLVAELGDDLEVGRIDNRGPDGRPDGTVSLFVAGGQALVLGGESRRMALADGDPDPRQIRLTLASDGADRPLAAARLGGGRLAGVLEFQDGALNATRDEVGLLAAALADTLGTRHAQGTDLDGRPGGELFRAGPPTVLAATGNARDAAGSPVATVSVTRVAGQGAALQASGYALRADPAAAGRLELTRLADGEVFGGLASGAEVDGLRLDVTGTPAPGDRFLLQPVSAAATDAAAPIADPRRIAAAGAGQAGRGQANVAALQGAAIAPVVRGATFAEAHARLIGALGVRVQTARSASDASSQVLAASSERLATETGVNLDEEAARLIQFQQSYQAAAKVLVTAQRLFETVLSIGG